MSLPRSSLVGRAKLVRTCLLDQGGDHGRGLIHGQLDVTAD